MDLTQVIGLAAGTLTTMSFVPQVVKTWRTKSARDISAAMLSILALGLALWLVYGIKEHDTPIIIANVVTLILASTLLILKTKYK